MPGDTATVEDLDSLIDFNADVPCCGGRTCKRGHAPAEWFMRFRCSTCGVSRRGLVCPVLHAWLLKLTPSHRDCGGTCVLVEERPI